MNIKADISEVCLKTERLVLRGWKETDTDDLYEYASVDGVGQAAGWMPHKNKEESLGIVHMFMTNANVFALEYQGKVIGSLGLERYNEKMLPELDEKRALEIGFVLSKDYWGKGLMPEAVKEVIRYCFEELKTDVLVCRHFVSNTRSGAVQKKCGFRHHLTYTDQNAYGVTGDHAVNLLWKEEWK